MREVGNVVRDLFGSRDGAEREAGFEGGGKTKDFQH